MPTQADKGHTFRTLHESPGAFVIPNPWDVGSARILTQLGFDALATTSAGIAFSLGRPDYSVDRDSMMSRVAAIAATTELPVSADLENGYGDTPEMVIHSIKLAVAAGVVGGSIEDATGRQHDPIYDHDYAVDRVRAAAETARAQAFPFTLTARCENYLHGRPNLKDTISRLQAYQEAGADVLYAPGLSTQEEIAELVRSVDRPVNVVMGLQGAQLSMAALSTLGVKRVSVGGSFCRSALGALIRAAREVREHGTFTFANEAVSHREMCAMLALTHASGK